MTRTILVAGGAGYIGSHMVKHLLEHDYQVIVLDDLSKGHADAVPSDILIRGSIGDARLLDQIFRQRSIDAVMHFAGFIEVGESVRKPEKYYRNNFANTLVLTEAMCRHEVSRFIFSSTAAVYGNPLQTPISEAHPLQPINPYGASKLMAEQALRDFDHARGLKSIVLRYFNAAGADPGGQLGERHHPETHLIPLVLDAALGVRDAITIYGDDYDTEDGTCVRDYVHVADLCQAHRLALDSLLSGGSSKAYNLGNGRGFSVREVIDTASRVAGRAIPFQIGARRAGDPARLVADSRKIKQELAWSPEYASLETIIGHAWTHRREHFKGHGSSGLWKPSAAA
ncbi:UDP-glucose 4-epimerase GalE [Thiorhodococcus minor]|uniref:UDP-glucose 4-epimerase n=1 Tax=Thiorhodococcus minor TaxID=57489 RepID=A0A6M0K0H7_9GAMM|nr:UDP-glucose 4-epimerase GalE [Thiorhodococcus minor]NEV62841.1 UDP-glucose 4-epimerase GalE [Thiorhodococcus minor]